MNKDVSVNEKMMKNIIILYYYIKPARPKQTRDWNETQTIKKNQNLVNSWTAKKRMQIMFSE